jgi:hypothetical protein
MQQQRQVPRAGLGLGRQVLPLLEVLCEGILLTVPAAE